MLNEKDLKDLLNLYAKHGWTLRRVLLSDASRSTAPESFGDAEVVESDIDAAWFSRVSTPGSTAWELRSLAASPFALVTVLNDRESDDALADTEQRLRETLARRT